MDILAHTLYGATLCSRSGLAGGRRGAIRPDGSPVRYDWTVPVAMLFGILPDLCSLGIFLTPYLLRAEEPDWHAIPAFIFPLYKITHSLVVAALGLLVIRLLWRPLSLPALAWALHIAMDAFTHQQGRFQTPLFYPLSDFHFQGLNWWEHPGVIYGYWAFLPVLWVIIIFWRRSELRHAAAHRAAEQTPYPPVA